MNIYGVYTLTWHIIVSLFFFLYFFRDHL